MIETKAKSSIKAFGPQLIPLNEEKNSFGVRGEPINDWVSCLAWPEIWMKMKSQTADGEQTLEVRFVGLNGQMPLAFVFYIEAKEARIGDEIYKTKTLNKFCGDANLVHFDDVLEIANVNSHKVQLIPLAGENSCWGADFALVFEMSEATPQATFIIYE